MKIGLGAMLGLNLSCVDLDPMWGSGQVQHMEWAGFDIEIGPGPLSGLNMFCVDLGQIYGLGQVQCGDLARPKADIELA